MGGSQEERSPELQEASGPQAPLSGEQTEQTAARSVTTASPARTRSTGHRRRLLSAARLCLGPGSYHGVRGCPGQALESRLPPATGASCLSACGLCVTVRRGLALRRALLSPDPAARRRPGCRSPCGSRVVVQPGSPSWRAGAAHRAATPGGQFQSLQTALTVSTTVPKVSECSGLSQACTPAGCSQPHLPSFGTSPACWTLEGIPGCPPEVAAKPRRLAPSLPFSLPPSSIHLPGSRAQSPASPWDQALIQ